jgi:hypothetical protein
MEFEQRLSDRLGNDSSDFAFPMKFYFAFGRMDVDVHTRRVDFQEKAAYRVSPFH